MTSDTAHRGGFLGFLTTIPGIITALAGLITAMVGLAQLAPESYDPPSPGPDQAQQPVIVNITPDTTPVENVAANADSVASFTDVSTSDPVQQMVDACAAGSVDACTGLLDILTDECYQGLGLSCDILYQVSPVDSDYETYGATCGGRLTWDYAGMCGQL